MLLQQVSMDDLLAKPKEQTIAKEGFQVFGLRPTTPRLILYLLLCLCTGGIFFILGYFLPQWRSTVLYAYTALADARRVLIKRKEEGTWMYDIKTVFINTTGHNYFEYMCIRYVYDDSKGTFERASYSLSAVPFRKIVKELGQGIQDDATYREQRAMFGRNVLDVPVPSFPRLLASEVFHPFYLFQLFSCGVWYWEQYWIYATCIVVISSVSALITAYQAKQNRLKLSNMVHAGCDINCTRNGQVNRMPSSELVPGDLVQVEADITLPCDMILLTGNAVINEASLTGESIPVLKSPLPAEDDTGYNPDHYGKHTLFNGTQVLQVKSANNVPVMALVSTTGFSTEKGELIRSIMHPKPTKFKFYKESFRFIMFLAGLAGICFFYTVILFSTFGAPASVILIRALDMITIAIPPALPVATTIGIAFSVARLQKQDIFCIAPSKVNVCGRTDKMCFDKTGTICEDGLSVFGVHPCSPKAGFTADLLTHVSNVQAPLIWSLAACHTLNMLDTRIIGDPLDVEMFESTHWSLEEHPETKRIIVASPDQTDSLEIIKYFEFSSLLQRQSAIVRHGQDLFLFAKGSPEMIKSLSRPDTIPNDFQKVEMMYTHQGKRVIALAAKKLGTLDGGASAAAASAAVASSISLLDDILRKPRQDMEVDLEFQALFILQNKLRFDSLETILRLQNGSVWNAMVTGDNEYTAINVARHCGIISSDKSAYLVNLTTSDSGAEELTYTFVPSDYGHTGSDTDESIISGPRETVVSMTNPTLEPMPFSWYDDNVAVGIHGKAFAHMQASNQPVYEQMLRKACVYARMSPINKTHLVEGLQGLNYTVGMCGDGANDCGALKAADVGLSLSEAEASVAAPFTSKNPTIAAVYKYMAIYSLLQTISVVILYSVSYESRLRDPQFLWIDLFLIFPLSFLMARTEPRKKLSSHKPPESLLARSIVVSILLQIIVHGIFQIGVFLYTRNIIIPEMEAAAGLLMNDTNSEALKICTVFVFANFQYISSVVAFSIGRPFREPIWTNYLYSLAIVVLSLACLYLLFIPDSITSWLLSLEFYPLKHRFIFFGGVVINSIAVWCLERFIIVGLIGVADKKKTH